MAGSTERGGGMNWVNVLQNKYFDNSVKFSRKYFYEPLFNLQIDLKPQNWHVYSENLEKLKTNPFRVLIILNNLNFKSKINL